MFECAFTITISCNSSPTPVPSRVDTIHTRVGAIRRGRNYPTRDTMAITLTIVASLTTAAVATSAAADTAITDDYAGCPNMCSLNGVCQAATCVCDEVGFSELSLGCGYQDLLVHRSAWIKRKCGAN